MEYLWIVALVLILDAFVFAWLIRSGKAPNFPEWMPYISFAVGAVLFLIWLLV
jgi:hypothetical protein